MSEFINDKNKFLLDPDNIIIPRDWTVLTHGTSFTPWDNPISNISRSTSGQDLKVSQIIEVGKTLNGGLVCFGDEDEKLARLYVDRNSPVLFRVVVPGDLNAFDEKTTAEALRFLKPDNLSKNNFLVPSGTRLVKVCENSTKDALPVIWYVPEQFLLTFEEALKYADKIRKEAQEKRAAEEVEMDIDASFAAPVEEQEVGSLQVEKGDKYIENLEDLEEIIVEEGVSKEEKKAEKRKKDREKARAQDKANFERSRKEAQATSDDVAMRNEELGMRNEGSFVAEGEKQYSLNDSNDSLSSSVDSVYDQPYFEGSASREYSELYKHNDIEHGEYSYEGDNLSSPQFPEDTYGREATERYNQDQLSKAAEPSENVYQNGNHQVERTNNTDGVAMENGQWSLENQGSLSDANASQLGMSYEEFGTNEARAFAAEPQSSSQSPLTTEASDQFEEPGIVQSTAQYILVPEAKSEIYSNDAFNEPSSSVDMANEQTSSANDRPDYISNHVDETGKYSTYKGSQYEEELAAREEKERYHQRQENSGTYRLEADENNHSNADGEKQTLSKDDDAVVPPTVKDSAGDSVFGQGNDNHQSEQQGFAPRTNDSASIASDDGYGREKAEKHVQDQSSQNSTMENAYSDSNKYVDEAHLNDVGAGRDTLIVKNENAHSSENNYDEELIARQEKENYHVRQETLASHRFEYKEDDGANSVHKTEHPSDNYSSSTRISREENTQHSDVLPKTPNDSRVPPVASTRDGELLNEPVSENGSSSGISGDLSDKRSDNADYLREKEEADNFHFRQQHEQNRANDRFDAYTHNENPTTSPTGARFNENTSTVKSSIENVHETRQTSARFNDVQQSTVRDAGTEGESKTKPSNEEIARGEHQRFNQQRAAAGGSPPVCPVCHSSPCKCGSKNNSKNNNSGNGGGGGSFVCPICHSAPCKCKNKTTIQTPGGGTVQQTPRSAAGTKTAPGSPLSFKKERLRAVRRLGNSVAYGIQDAGTSMGRLIVNTAANNDESEAARTAVSTVHILGSTTRFMDSMVHGSGKKMAEKIWADHLKDVPGEKRKGLTKDERRDFGNFSKKNLEKKLNAELPEFELQELRKRYGKDIKFDSKELFGKDAFRKHSHAFDNGRVNVMGRFSDKNKFHSGQFGVGGRIGKLRDQSIELKRRIKDLKAKGSLTTAEKNLLADLISKKSKIDQELRIYVSAGNEFLSKRALYAQILRMNQNRLKKEIKNLEKILKKGGVLSIEQGKQLRAMKERLALLKMQRAMGARKMFMRAVAVGGLAASLFNRALQRSRDETMMQVSAMGGGVYAATPHAKKLIKFTIKTLKWNLKLVFRPVMFIDRKLKISSTVKTVVGKGKDAAVSRILHSRPSKVLSSTRKRVVKVGEKALNRIRTSKAGKVAEKAGKVAGRVGKRLGKIGRGVGKVFKGVKKVVTAPFKAVNFVVQGIKKVFMKFILMPIAIVILACFMLTMLGTGLAAIADSFILFDDEAEDGRIDLTKYIKVMNDEKEEIDSQISAYRNDTKANGGKYDRVFVSYYGGSNSNNYKEILAMAAVRFDQDFSDKGAVKDYIRNLYNRSNYLTTETVEYKCSGCEERDYHCTDGIEGVEYVTQGRKRKHMLFYGLGGCVEENYYCTERVYPNGERNPNYNSKGCKLHNGGVGMEDPEEVGCDNYEIRYSFRYGDMAYCNGHGCSGDHVHRYCTGHVEKICRGHEDLYVSVTSLGFDQIFSADDTFTDLGDYKAGDSLGIFKITYYCAERYAHICNDAPSGGTDDGLTATGSILTPGRTVAVDPDVIPYGTKLVIGGHVYEAEDCGGAIKENKIDIAVATHDEALRNGVDYFEVFYAEEGDSGEKDTKDDEYGFAGWNAENKTWAKDLYSNITSEDYAGLDLIPSGSGSGGGSISLEGVTLSSSKNRVVYYSQKDSRWANRKIIGNYNATIGSSGCGFTSMSMIVSTLSETTMDPRAIVNKYGNLYYVKGVGASWNMIPGIARDYGISCTELAKNNVQGVINALKSGSLVVVSVGKGGSGYTGDGYYTGAGHFIVIYGVTEDGKFLLADPNKPEISMAETGVDMQHFLNSGVKVWWKLG